MSKKSNRKNKKSLGLTGQAVLNGFNTPNRSLTVGSFAFGNATKTLDYRFDPLEILVASRDGIVNRCVRLLINSVLDKNYSVECDRQKDKELIHKLLANLDFYKNSEWLLNSILSTGGDCIAYFVEETVEEQAESGEIYLTKKHRLNLESTFWAGYRRLSYTVDANTKKITGTITVQTKDGSKIKILPSEKVFFFTSSNLANDFLGITPLMLCAHRVLEKMSMVEMSKTTALKMGKLDGLFTPKVEMLKGITPQEQINLLSQLDTLIDTISKESNTLKNYAVTGTPLDFIKLQASSREMEYNATIENINYDICATFGVPPSLVHFSPSTDPNLSNAEQYTDNFYRLSIQNLKKKLEQFWIKVISTVLPDVQFTFEIAKEATDETIKLREQFMKAVELCDLLQNKLNIKAVPSLEGLRKLGIEVLPEKNSAELNLQNTDSSSSFEINEILQEVPATKYNFQKPNPSFVSLLRSKNYRKFKAVIHDNLKGQIDGLFSKLTKSPYSDNKFFEEISKKLPKLKLKQDQLIKEIKTNIIPYLLEQYNAFYDTKWEIDNLPEEISRSLTNLATLTLQGDGLNYKGIDQATAERLTAAIEPIIQKKDLTLQDYSALTDQQKKQVYQELNKTGKNIILQTRTDLISELIASGSFNQAYATLAKVDGRTFVAVRTVNDKRVRPSHRINEGKYFATSLKAPYLEPLCRCTYIFADEQTLLNQGFTPL